MTQTCNSTIVVAAEVVGSSSGGVSGESAPIYFIKIILYKELVSRKRYEEQN